MEQLQAHDFSHLVEMRFSSFGVGSARTRVWCHVTSYIVLHDREEIFVR